MDRIFGYETRKIMFVDKANKKLVEYDDLKEENTETYF
jgi:hypothetical protein